VGYNGAQSAGKSTDVSEEYVDSEMLVDFQCTT
jgi:hypothetical protein